LALSLPSGHSLSGQSFAPEPPKNDGVTRLLKRRPLLVDEAIGRPLPTSDWWTTLLAEKTFPGKLFAYPLTISANPAALKIWYPKGWSGDGTMLVEGEPLLVEPVDPSPPPATSKLLFDFETNWKEMG